jgi:hypothetical protein
MKEKSEFNTKFVNKMSENDMELFRSRIQKEVVDNLLKKYQIIKIRMKISFMAFKSKMTI